MVDQPLLARLEAGDDPQELAELAIELRQQHRRTPSEYA